MDAERDVALLRKLSHFGLVNPMHDRARLGEIAATLTELADRNEKLKTALRLALKFIEDHMQEAGVTGPDAMALMEAIASATETKQHVALLEQHTVVEYVLPVGDDGRADTTVPTVVETTYGQGTIDVTTYSPATGDEDGIDRNQFDTREGED